MKIGPRHISPKLYKKILSVLPIACADAVIVCRGKFLLGKRKNKPAKGQWFLIGGRILKGEKLEGTIRRHIRLETGIRRMRIQKLLGARETIFRNSAQGPSSHTVSFVYSVSFSSRKVSPANLENRELQWFSRINKNWHPYVREMLKNAGFK